LIDIVIYALGYLHLSIGNMNEN